MSEGKAPAPWRSLVAYLPGLPFWLAVLLTPLYGSCAAGLCVIVPAVFWGLKNYHRDYGGD